MKKTEYNEIMNTIDNFAEQEKRLCKEYIALNPYYEQERKKDMELILFACSMIKTNLAEKLKIK